MKGPNIAKIWQLWRQDLPSDGGLKEPFPYRAWKWLWQRIPTRNTGSDLFNRLEETDWDVLVLLDACRYDVLNEVSTNAVINRTRSPASATPEFLSIARERDVFDGTKYVSGNPQTEDNRPGDVEHVPVFEDHWANDLSTVPPDPLYHAAREELATDDEKPIVVHTLQPHFPHLSSIGGETCAVPGGLHPIYLDERLRDEKLQALLANGYVSLDRAKRSYRQSVRYAWDRASEFAATVAADGHRVVVSSDHGETFGESGFVEHPVGVPLADLRAVPWVVFEPPTDTETADDVSDRLAALGYVES